jgi:proteasome accessory factor B
VEIAFAAQIAPYVRARVWHPSQEVRDQDDGSLTLTMEVCHDLALRSWILSWGPSARVVLPDKLAAEVKTDLDAARKQYT